MGLPGPVSRPPDHDSRSQERLTRTDGLKPIQPAHKIKTRRWR